MTALIVIGLIIVGVISFVMDEGGFLAKLTLGGFVAAIAFLLLGWITDWDLMFTLAKAGAAAGVVSALINILAAIAG